MGRWLALCSLLIIASCSGSIAAKPTSSSPSSPSAKAPACTLPAMLWTTPNPETQGGFIGTATGSCSPDRQSVMIVDGATGLYRMLGRPYPTSTT